MTNETTTSLPTGTDTTTTAELSAAKRFDERADRFTAIARAVGERWGAPTPCIGWTARDVVEHVIDTQRDFLGRVGQGLPDIGPGITPGPSTDGGPGGASPIERWSTHAAQVAGILAADGVAETSYDSHFGPTTIGQTMADFYGWDLVIHGSDLARAVGMQWAVTEEEADALLAVADGWGGALYAEGICSPAIAVGDGASPTERLLARLGRDPRWQPSAG